MDLAAGRRPAPLLGPDRAYCSARNRLPEEACSRLAQRTGRQVDEEAPASWRWLGHRVLDVDGSTNHHAGHRGQPGRVPATVRPAPRLRLPIARVVVVFSLAVGTVLEAALGKYQGKQTGENSLFRTLHPLLQEDDVVLADRYYAAGSTWRCCWGAACTAWSASTSCGPPTSAPAGGWGAAIHVVNWGKPKRPAG